MRRKPKLGIIYSTTTTKKEWEKMKGRNKIAKMRREALPSEVKKFIQGKSKKLAMKSSFWRPKQLGN